ncbi:MAG: hypothetical protein ACU0FT_08105 [Paracoccus sp. (in: a-proteobacteria)]|uniref:hypothetical protein n=1 Tax=Paracoccus sp. TaxID=267 RepID=UPI00405A23F2
MSRTFVTSAEVAHQLDMSLMNFLRKRAQLIDDHGFPQPMPHQSSPLLWRADQIAHWIAGQGLPRDPEERIDPKLLRAGKVALLAEARRP